MRLFPVWFTSRDEDGEDTGTALYLQGPEDYFVKPLWHTLTYGMDLNDGVLCAALMGDPAYLLTLKSGTFPSLEKSMLGEDGYPIYERIGTIDLRSLDFINLYEQEPGRIRPVRCDRNRKLRSIPQFEMRIETFFLA